MTTKLHTFEMKKVEYKKHLQRLTTIYNSKQKSKRKVFNEIKQINKRLEQQHRLHNSSSQSNNLFNSHFKFYQNDEKSLSHVKQINHQQHNHSVNSQLEKQEQNFSKAKKVFKMPLIQKPMSKQTLKLQKQNRNIMIRLMRVKPTICLNKSLQIKKSNQTQRNTFRRNNLKYDFSDIFNESAVKLKQQQIDGQTQICLRLHKHNEEVIKMKFTDGIKDLMNQNKLYYFACQNGPDIIQSQCFTFNELITSQLKVYKKKTDQLEFIQLRELLFDKTKSICKGFLNLISEHGQQKLQFLTITGKRIWDVEVHIERRNLKIKYRKPQLQKINQVHIQTNSKKTFNIFTSR